MNAALLVLSMCAGGADTGCGTSPCVDCNTTSHCSSCCEKEGFLSKLRNIFKRSCCNECEVQCDHAGPIPGTEHPTTCQRLKDRICPCSPCGSSSCGCHYTYMKSGCVRIESNCSSCNTCGTPSTCNSCGCDGEVRGLWNRLSSKFSRCKSHDCDSCNTTGETVINNKPEVIPTRPKMPKADESRKEPMPLPSGTKKVERIEMMPSQSVAQPAVPAQFSAPRVLELGSPQN